MNLPEPCIFPTCSKPGEIEVQGTVRNKFTKVRTEISVWVCIDCCSKKNMARVVDAEFERRNR